MSFPQVFSLLPLDPLLNGGLCPPNRRATPQPARGRLRAAPPVHCELSMECNLTDRGNSNSTNPTN